MSRIYEKHRARGIKSEINVSKSISHQIVNSSRFGFEELAKAYANDEKEKDNET